MARALDWEVLTMPIRRLLAGCLLLAPLLMTAAEAARLTIPGAEDEATKLGLIAAGRDTWELFAWLTLGLVLAWLGATLGLVEALRGLRPRAAAVGGAVAVAGAVAFAMHQMQYAEINAVLSSSPGYVQAAGEVGVHGTRMEDATVVIELVGIWLGPIILTASLAQAGRLAWWTFACIPTWAVLFALAGSVSPAFAALHLLLVPPFLAVARTLLQPPAQEAAGSSPFPLSQQQM
jgi:hypothetical protein